MSNRKFAYEPHNVGKFTTLSVDDGTAALPSLAFASDLGTGFCLLADGTIGVSSGGQEKWRFVGNTFRGTNLDGAAMQNEAASAFNPTLNPRRSDKDTGLGSEGPDVTSLIAGGVEGYRMVETGGVINQRMAGKVLIGAPLTDVPFAPFEVVGAQPGTAGGHSSGILQMRSTGTNAFASCSMTGHSSFGGNKQLWFFGSLSGSNDDVGLVNRNNAKMGFWTNNIPRVEIPAAGGLTILGVTGGFTLPNMTTGQRDLLDRTNGMMIYNVSIHKVQAVLANVWTDL